MTQQEAIKVQVRQRTVDLNTDKIKDSIRFAATGLDKVDVDMIHDEICESLYDSISTDEIINLSIKTASSYISAHYQYSFLAARLLLQKLYKEIFGHSVYEQDEFYSKIYVEYFDEYLEKGMEFNLIDPAIKTFDLEKIKAAIKPERDLIYKEAGMGRIYKQYLLKTNTDPQKVFELPQFWMMRVAMGLAKMEKNKEEKAIEFYNMLSTNEVLSSTPTLLNSGRVRNQCSSCFLTFVDDDLEKIFKGFSDVAKLSKYAGGLGVDVTSVRATGSLIKGTNGKSLGLAPFLKVLDSTAAAVNQGGVRKGAVAASIEPWHKDIYDFISSKYMSVDENRRCPNIHTSLWIPDLFMKRVIENKEWTLFSPSDVPDLHEKYGREFEKAYENYEKDESISKEKVWAVELWREVLVSLIGKGFGHPWINWKDSCNVRNPQSHDGVIHSSNLCTEVVLNTSNKETAVCNLASINLSKYVKDGEVDWDRLGEVTKVTVRMLDNVIDSNFYATPEAEYSNKKHRPIGLGVMGYQDMIQQLGISFNSEENVKFSDKLFEFLSYNSIESSMEIAKEKGAYSTFEGSKWQQGIFPYDAMLAYEKEREYKIAVAKTITMDWDKLKAEVKEHGMRNCQLMAIAPTRSISYIGGTSPSIEPWDSNIFTEVGMTGKYTMINDRLVDALEEAGVWNEEMVERLRNADGSIQSFEDLDEDLRNRFKTAYEVHPKWNIASNAVRQKWIDMAISFNQWLPGTNGKDAERLYLECWKSGLKTTYYLHSRSASQAEKLASKPASKESKMEIGKVCDLTDPNCEACQ